jgi:VacB/RNase II family 3'-5' exoribonuclease
VPKIEAVETVAAVKAPARKKAVAKPEIVAPKAAKKPAVAKNAMVDPVVAKKSVPSKKVAARKVAVAEPPVAPLAPTAKAKPTAKPKATKATAIAIAAEPGSAPVPAPAAPIIPPNTVIGTIIGHADGFGFVKLDQGGDDMYVSEDSMRAVLHGDRVAVRATGSGRDGKTNAEIVSVLQRANHRVVGKLRSKEGQWFVVASERRINQDILIPRGKLGKAALDQIVVAEITSQPTPYDEATGEIVEVVGDEDSSDIELEIAIRKHNLPYVFSAATLKQAAAYGDVVTAADRSGRTDLRELALVTIDGETAKDFDDAVYAEKSGKGFRLVVAIADVSHYVKLKTALDTDARERTTSVYFPRRVIPMLPENLSNELCSLRPNVDRLCMVCDMQVASSGNVSSYTFYAAVMNSKARLTYTEVAAMLPDLVKAKPKAGITENAQRAVWRIPQSSHAARCA